MFDIVGFLFSFNQFVACSAAGSDQVWVRANDGQSWADWKSWNVNSWPHASDAAPVVSAQTQGLLRGETVAAASLFSVSDTDGDAPASYGSGTTLTAAVTLR